MIYTGLGRLGEIADIKAHGGVDVAEVYGSINESNPIYYKAITITGTSPLTFKGLGLPLKDYCIYGNTVQDGTPTPEDPVDVVGCGVKTGQLALSYNATGHLDRHVAALYVDFDIKPNTEYTLSFDALQGTALYFNEYIFTSYTNFVTYGSRCYVTRTTKSSIPANQHTNSGWLVLKNASTLQSDPQIANIMLSLGSTHLPYEPYGYKLPLTIGGTEYPIYLGQVPTTRKVKKLVLTGYENWETQPNVYINNTALFAVQQDQTQIGKMTNRQSINTHFISTAPGVNPQRQDYVCSGYHPADGYSDYYYIRPDFSTIGITSETTGAAAIVAFKTWLRQQYAAGTPVTVWCVLATPETGIVNEPLHKISTYADTISMAQAGVIIQTIAGANTLTIDTTVQPSAVSITGNIKEVSR